MTNIFDSDVASLSARISLGADDTAGGGGGGETTPVVMSPAKVESATTKVSIMEAKSFWNFFMIFLLEGRLISQ